MNHNRITEKIKAFQMNSCSNFIKKKNPKRYHLSNSYVTMYRRNSKKKKQTCQINPQLPKEKFKGISENVSKHMSEEIPKGIEE